LHPAILKCTGLGNFILRIAKGFPAEKQGKGSHCISEVNQVEFVSGATPYAELKGPLT
jgi:hypothetical protein